MNRAVVNMEAIREVTEWPDDLVPPPNHIYLMEGERAVAYLKFGAGEPIYFTPFRLIKTRRKFVKSDVELFTK